MTGKARVVGLTVFLFLCPILLSDATGQQSAGITRSQNGFLTGSFGVDPLVEFENQLNAVLRTTRVEERVFVHEVVENLRNGKLSLKLIQSSYGWVRNKRPDTKYPFILFERVIRLQAKKLGQESSIPDFDRQIYKKRQPRISRFFRDLKKAIPR